MRSSEPVTTRKGRVGLYAHDTIFLMCPPPTSPTELPESHMITWFGLGPRPGLGLG